MSHSFYGLTCPQESNINDLVFSNELLKMREYADELFTRNGRSVFYVEESTNDRVITKGSLWTAQEVIHGLFADLLAEWNNRDAEGFELTFEERQELRAALKEKGLALRRLQAGIMLAAIYRQDFRAR